MPLPLAIATARMRLCHNCPHYCHRPTWRWYRCTHGITTIEAEPHAPECGDPWWQAEASTCPANTWQPAISIIDQRVHLLLNDQDQDVGPVDSQAYHAEISQRARLSHIHAQRHLLKPQITRTLAHRPPPFITDFLAIFTNIGLLAPELALELSQQLIPPGPPQ